MANNYTLIAATQTLPITCEAYSRLLSLLEEENAGFTVELLDQQLYVYTEESGTPEDLPEEFRRALGEVIAAANMEYLEFGYACYGDRNAPGERGGGAFRILRDGTIVDAESVWPTYSERDKEIVALAKETRGKGGDIEFDPDAPVSDGDDNGAYVQAWVWVSFAGTRLDKEKPDLPEPE